MLTSLFTFSAPCFLRLLLRRLSSRSNKSAMTSHVCAPENVPFHLVLTMYFQLLFSRPLDSPTQSIFRCFLAEYPTRAHLNKSFTAVRGAMLSASHRPKGVFFLPFLLSQLACCNFGLVQELLWE